MYTGPYSTDFCANSGSDYYHNCNYSGYYDYYADDKCDNDYYADDKCDNDYYADDKCDNDYYADDKCDNNGAILLILDDGHSGRAGSQGGVLVWKSEGSCDSSPAGSAGTALSVMSG